MSLAVRLRTQEVRGGTMCLEKDRLLKVIATPKLVDIGGTINQNDKASKSPFSNGAIV